MEQVISMTDKPKYNRIVILTAGLLCLIIPLMQFPLLCRAETAEEKGLAIAREADRRDSGYGDSTADMLMILRNRHGQESRREMRVRTLEVGL